MNNTEFLTVEETANKMKVSIRTVQKLCRDGKIKGAKRLGRRWYIGADYLLQSIIG